MMRPAVFYNLDNGRDPKKVNLERKAILDTRPAIFGWCEGFGYRFPPVAGYDLLHSTATPGRWNVGAYVDKSLGLLSWNYTDSALTWERPDRPGQQHWPRSTLHARLEDGRQLVIGHRPPNTRLHDTGPAQAEWDAIVGRLLTRGRDTRSRVALADWNGRPVELATHVDGRIRGNRNDAAVTVNMDAGPVKYVSEVRGVPLKSDHRHALMVWLDL